MYRVFVNEFWFITYKEYSVLPRFPLGRGLSISLLWLAIIQLRKNYSCDMLHTNVVKKKKKKKGSRFDLLAKKRLLYRKINFFNTSLFLYSKVIYRFRKYF